MPGSSRETRECPERFFGVARLARQRQVADAVRAAAGLGVDVLYLQRHVLRVAVGAGAMEFLEQVFTHLISGQRALLVLRAGDFRILQSRAWLTGA